MICSRPGTGERLPMARAISSGPSWSSSRASTASAAKSALSTLTAPVSGVVIRWPRQVNSVWPARSTMSLASVWRTATVGMRARSSSRRPHGSSALTMPRKT